MLKKIRNTHIIELTFSHLRNKKKLNIIKYNNKLLSRLNITKEDFKSYIYLKEFNEKFNLNIEDVDIIELDLSNHLIGNEGLEYLAKIKFNKLRILDLSDNQIIEISLLEKLNLEKLIISNLSFNQISDINVLEKVNFKELRELHLVNNIISDINVLKRVKFEKLEILNFGNQYKLLNNMNNLNDPTIIEVYSFTKGTGDCGLKAHSISEADRELNKSGNEISDINVLEKVDFQHLKVLNY